LDSRGPTSKGKGREARRGEGRGERVGEGRRGGAITSGYALAVTVIVIIIIVNTVIINDISLLI